MKQSIFTLAIATMLNYCYGFNESTLNISMFNQTKFNLIVDGVVYQNSQSSYTIQNLTPGIHSIEITRFVNRSYYSTPTMQCLFDGTINIPVVASNVVASLNPQRRLIIQRIVPLAGPGTCGNNSWSNENNYSSSDSYNHNENYYPVIHPANNNCINQNNFEQLKYSIASKTFESTKIEIAREQISRNYFNTQQIIELINLFTFESSKIELAKLAYRNTIDKQNFFRVYDTFTFESSIRELQQFIYGRS